MCGKNGFSSVARSPFCLSPCFSCWTHLVTNFFWDSHWELWFKHQIAIRWLKRRRRQQEERREADDGSSISQPSKCSSISPPSKLSSSPPNKAEACNSTEPTTLEEKEGRGKKQHLTDLEPSERILRHLWHFYWYNNNQLSIFLFYLLSFIFQNKNKIKKKKVIFGQNFLHECPGFLCLSVLNSPSHLHHYWWEGRGSPLGGSSCCLCREAEKPLLWKPRQR